jgi:hypothetical protein
MLRSNGYPESTIRRAHSKSPSPDNIRKRKERQRQDGVLILPYVTKATTYKVKRAIKRSGLDVFLAERSGPTLKSLLTRSALISTRCPSRGPCLACLAGLEGRCTTKNVLNCTICSECYIGEMKRPVRERLMEYCRAAASGNIQNPGEHTIAPNTATLPPQTSPLRQP